MNIRHPLVHRWLRVVILVLLVLSASARAQPPEREAQETALVFGRLLLVVDGEESAFSWLGSWPHIMNLGSTDPARRLDGSFEKDGRFQWSMRPGAYLLNIQVNRFQFVTIAFRVPAASKAYYFGNWKLNGIARRFIGPELVNVSVDDRFDTEATTLLQQHAKYSGNAEKMEVWNASRNESRHLALRKVLDAAPLCCRSMSEFQFEKLALDATIKSEIDQDKGAFEFPGGRSYFKAFELPRYVSPYAISVSSFAAWYGVGAGEILKVFVPAAMLLDEQFRVLEVRGADWFHPSPQGIFSSPSLEGRLQISSANSHARYLVLYTTDALIRSLPGSTRPGVIEFFPGIALPTGKKHSLAMVPVLAGRVEIRLQQE